MYDSPATLADSCDEAVRAAAIGVRKAATATDDSAVLCALNQAIAALEDPLGWSELLNQAHPDEAMRHEAGRCQARLAKFRAELAQNLELYERLLRVNADHLSPGARRFLTRRLTDFQREGVHLSRRKREALRELRSEMVHTGQVFHSALAATPPTITLEAGEMDGLPENWAAAQTRDSHGNLLVPMTADRYQMLVSSAANRAVRERAHVAFTSRGSETNGPVLRRLLRLRRRYANLLGYDDWVDYSAGRTMAGSGADSESFLSRLEEMTSDSVATDLAQLASIPGSPVTDDLESWDTPYYAQRLQDQVSAEASAAGGGLFRCGPVLERLFALIEGAFGVQFTRVYEPSWHSSVAVYAASVDGVPRGVLHMDLAPRPGKPTPAVTFPLTTGRLGGPAPSVALVACFDRDEPMWLDEVVTLIHEMGHVLHHLLSCESKWVTQCGTRVEFDVVEVPGMVFEGFAKSPAVLAQLAGRDDPKTRAMLERLCEARSIGSGILAQRQALLAAISIGLHRADPDTLDFDACMDEQFDAHGPWPRSDGDHWYANLWHLVDYGPDYYSYLWSAMIARDMLEHIIDDDGITRDGAAKLLRTVLSAGAREDGADLVASFLGQPWRFHQGSDEPVADRAHQNVTPISEACRQAGRNPSAEQVAYKASAGGYSR